MTKPCSRKDTIEMLKVVIGNMEENMRLLAPNGWESSPYFAFFHPTAHQQFQADLSFHKNLKVFENDPPPVIEDYEDDTEPIKEEAELQELLGRVLYELLDEDQIVSPCGCIYDVDRNKYCAEVIAQFLNMHYPTDEIVFTLYSFFNVGNIHKYIDPYPVYVLFFQRLKAKGYKIIFGAEHSSPRRIKAYKEVYG